MIKLVKNYLESSLDGKEEKEWTRRRETIRWSEAWLMVVFGRREINGRNGLLTSGSLRRAGIAGIFQG